MKLARAWAVAGLMAALTAVTGGPAGAQEKKAPTPMPMAVPDQTGAISVTLGGQVRFQMATKRPIAEALNENDRVAQVLADASDRSFLVIRGLTAGTSRLTVKDADGKEEKYLIVVTRDVEALRNLIRKTIPTKGYRCSSSLPDVWPARSSGYTPSVICNEASSTCRLSRGWKRSGRLPVTSRTTSTTCSRS